MAWRKREIESYETTKEFRIFKGEEINQIETSSLQEVDKIVWRKTWIYIAVKETKNSRIKKSDVKAIGVDGTWRSWKRLWKAEIAKGKIKVRKVSSLYGRSSQVKDKTLFIFWTKKRLWVGKRKRKITSEIKAYQNERL